MAKRKAAATRKKAKPGKKPAARRTVKSARAAARKPASRGKRRTVRQAAKRRATSRASKRNAAPRAAARKPAGAKARSKPAAPPPSEETRTKASRLDRARRILEETVPTPPSSLDMNRRGSAVRTGRAELEQDRELHATMTPAITGGDVDVDVENAYFSGDEAPGGDNPTPDQDVVDDIGRALGVEYQDNEELRASDKVGDRDKRRWELDPASAEDYKERK
jgi:hypothetical protein